MHLTTTLSHHVPATKLPRDDRKRAQVEILGSTKGVHGFEHIWRPSTQYRGARRFRDVIFIVTASRVAATMCDSGHTSMYPREFPTPGFLPSLARVRRHLIGPLAVRTSRLRRSHPACVLWCSRPGKGSPGQAPRYSYPRSRAAGDGWSGQAQDMRVQPIRRVSDHDKRKQLFPCVGTNG